MCVFCFSSIRVHFNAAALLERDADGVVTETTAFFWSQPHTVTQGQQIDLNELIADFDMQLEAFNQRASGFVMKRLVRFTVSVHKYRPLAGHKYIPSPPWLKNKRCALNI